VQQDEARTQSALLQATLPGRGSVESGDLAAGLDLGPLVPRSEALGFELEVNSLALHHVGGQPVLRRCQRLTAEPSLPFAEWERAAPDPGKSAQRSRLA
jgi:hypothetical protein